MFRHKPSSSKSPQDPDVASGPLLTTEDIVLRLRLHRFSLLRRLLRWGAWLLGAVVAVACLILGVLHYSPVLEERSEAVSTGVHPTPAVEADVEPQLTPVDVHLGRMGSIFVDARHVGMQQRLLLQLAPGPHTIMVRFGSRSYSRTVQVRGRPLVLTCHPHRGWEEPQVATD